MTIHSGAVSAWSDILTSALAENPTLLTDCNFIMLHTIARRVFDHQQQQIYEIKQKPASSVLPAASPDDGLLRMCGAEVARMLKAKRKEKEIKLQHVEASHPAILSIDKHIRLLQRICIPMKDKESLKDSIPSSIQNLDKGYMYIPMPSLIPYLAEVDRTFREHVNNDKFQKHGHQLFKIILGQ